MASFLTRECCPACKSSGGEVLLDCPYTEDPVRGYVRASYGNSETTDLTPLAGAHFILTECAACGLVFQRDIPDAQLLHTIYEDWLGSASAYEYEREYTLNEYVTRAREILVLIRYFGVKPRYLSFLDVGMGWGTWCLMAKSFGVDAVGIELSESRVRFAQRNGVTVLRWEDLDAHRFDVINADQVFEHLPDPFETLCRLRDCLKDNGVLAFNVPNGGTIIRRLHRGERPAASDFHEAYNPVAPLEHINCFSHSSLLAMARRAGLQRVKIPLRLQYHSLVLGTGPKRVTRDLLRPLYYAFGSPTAILLRKL